MRAAARASCHLALLFAASLLAAGTTRADENLYESVFVVTGTGEANRMTGFAETFRAVLAKLSGDPDLAADLRVDVLAKQAGSLVSAYSYLDLRAGIQIHDEQGSYDRPHYLTVDFDPKKIDAVLASLGHRPWLDRPRLAVFLGVRRDPKAYVVAADTDRDEAMRESFAAASKRFGVPIVFPATGLLGARLQSVDSIPQADFADLDRTAKAAGADQALRGTLIWSDADHGWVADWEIEADGTIRHWQIRGVSFDDAFRNALGGAAEVLSGNGTP